MELELFELLELPEFELLEFMFPELDEPELPVTSVLPEGVCPKAKLPKTLPARIAASIAVINVRVLLEVFIGNK